MTFRCALIRLSLAVYNVNIIEFKQLLTSIIETIVNIIADEIKEVSFQLILKNMYFYFVFKINNQ